jgi:2-dehydro-3-deoxyphosphooctonate aldolase (KDO 8-P synthase)
MREIKINDKISISNELPIVFIAGTCVIESYENYHETIKYLKKLFSKSKINFIAKASFDKANRTSLKSYRGPGLEKGSEILKAIKKELDLTLLVDIHEPYQAEIVAKYADIIQIPAFLCRQTDIVLSAARTGKTVNIKKGQFISPWNVENIIKKIESTGNHKILLTERGFSFGYSNLVVDMRAIEIMKSFGYPVIFDSTHSVQKPGAMGDATGGEKEFIYPLSKAALSLKIAGLFFETHINPEKALSDGYNSIPLSRVKDFVSPLTKLDKFVKSLKEVRL